MRFKFVSKNKPSVDQEKAINSLINGFKAGKKEQVLLGATGTGKTFTIANLASKLNIPVLVIVHNKTLAIQLYEEFKFFFPFNSVQYFVSNFDFYRPEAYLPHSNYYIEKIARHNETINMFRLRTMNNLVSRSDVIVVASVAAIYGVHDVKEYRKSFFEVKVGKKQLNLKKFTKRLTEIGYFVDQKKTENGSFYFVKNEVILQPSWTESYVLKFSFSSEDLIKKILLLPKTSQKETKSLKSVVVFPAQDYLTSQERIYEATKRIEKEFQERFFALNLQGETVKAQRLKKRVVNDIAVLKKFGVCRGIENYSRHLELRSEGEPPCTVIDYFGKNFLMVVDESHMTLPQIKGMYETDRNRKRTLVEYGFRLPSALDNRPLNFKELQKKMNFVVYVSATPGKFELERTNGKTIQQIIRPTFILDPTVEIKNVKNQIVDIYQEVKKRIVKNERIFIITLTIKLAEEIANYFSLRNIKISYLHNKIKTLKRREILEAFRRGTYDVIVGINLLREGLDLPELSLVCILDADKEGFLRSTSSLIQIIGRAARNVNGHVILYAKQMTNAIKNAIYETERRRKIQQEHNRKYKHVPKPIKKPIVRLELVKLFEEEKKKLLSKKEKKNFLLSLRKKMFLAAEKWDFKTATTIKEEISRLKEEIS